MWFEKSEQGAIEQTSYACSEKMPSRFSQARNLVKHS